MQPRPHDDASRAPGAGDGGAAGARAQGLPTLEVLVSTFGDRIDRALEVPLDPIPGVSWLIVHQLGDGARAADRAPPGPVPGRPDVRRVELDGRGLSRSRNRALDEGRADLLLLADDDVRHSPQRLEAVRRAFAERPGADLLTFEIESSDGTPHRAYPAREYRHGRISAFHVASIEMAVRARLVRDLPVRFDERFGLGARYPACEETVFLVDCLRAGASASFVPTYIVSHPPGSSGSDWSRPLSREVRGALFRRVFGPLAGLPLLVAFAARQRRHFRGRCTVAGFLADALPAFVRFTP